MMTVAMMDTNVIQDARQEMTLDGLVLFLHFKSQLVKQFVKTMLQLNTQLTSPSHVMMEMPLVLMVAMLV